MLAWTLAGMLAETVATPAGFTWGKVLENLLTWGLISLITAGVTILFLKWQMADLLKRTDTLEKRHVQHTAGINSLQLAAKDCKRECERDFVNKAEYCRMVGTQDRFESELSHRIDEFRSSMDKKLESVHGRITDCATQIARIQGEASGKENLQ